VADEREAPIEIGLDTSVSIIVGPPGERVYVYVRIDRDDPPGVFRVRRGPGPESARVAPEEQVRPPGGARPELWADLGDTGLQVKLMALPVMTRPAGVEYGPLRIGLRRLEDVEA
jgi:hypothetical protein